MTTAMFKQLAPMAVMPPSPKASAWMTSAVDTARIAADGPIDEIVDRFQWVPGTTSGEAAGPQPAG